MRFDPARIRPEVAGRIMLGVAAVGVVVGLTATIVGWRLAGHLFDGVDDSLAVATQSLESVDESIVVVETIVADVRDGVGTLDRTVADVVVITETSAGAIDQLATQAPALASGVEGLRDGVAGAGEAAATIDSTLGAIGDLPGVPEYAPDRPLGETLAGLVDDLDGVAVTLRSIDGSIRDIDGAVQPLVDDLRQAREDLAALDRDLAASSTLLDQYRASAGEASDIAVRTRSGLSDDVLATRILIIAGGLLFVVGQIVPYWLGRTILLEVEATRLRTEAEADDAEAGDAPR